MDWKKFELKDFKIIGDIPPIDTQLIIATPNCKEVYEDKLFENDGEYYFDHEKEGVFYWCIPFLPKEIADGIN